MHFFILPFKSMADIEEFSFSCAAGYRLNEISADCAVFPLFLRQRIQKEVAPVLVHDPVDVFFFVLATFENFGDLVQVGNCFQVVWRLFFAEAAVEVGSHAAVFGVTGDLADVIERCPDGRAALDEGFDLVVGELPIGWDERPTLLCVVRRRMAGVAKGKGELDHNRLTLELTARSYGLFKMTTVAKHRISAEVLQQRRSLTACVLTAPRRQFGPRTFRTFIHQMIYEALNAILLWGRNLDRRTLFMSSEKHGQLPADEETLPRSSVVELQSDALLERRAPLWFGAGLLFMSGMCGLIFQVSWFREFRLLFGASTASSSAVLAVFMGGLGIGNAVLGARADRAKNPLAFYAVLEIFVALTAAISPFLIDALHGSYISLGGQLSLGVGGATVLRLAISVIVLGMPTFLMGGTLPAAVRAVTSDQDRQRCGAATLYGVNTFGAVVGAFSSTFFALQFFGTRNTLWLACGLNALTASLAFIISRRPLVETFHGKSTQNVSALVGSGDRRNGGAPLVSDSVIYAVSGIAGFSFFLMELVWYRMLGPILGGTTFTFGLILTVALVGIGLGAAAYPLIFFGRRRVSLHSLAFTCALEACCVSIPFALGDRLAILAAQLRGLNTWHFVGEVGGWSVIAAIVILPAALVSGVQFPLFIALLGQGDKEIGKQVGLTFGWNTVGAICGSLAGGFGLLPLLSAPGVWRGVALLLTLLGLCVFGLARQNARWPITAFATLLTTVMAVAMSAGTGPTAVWRHGSIGAGRGVSIKEIASANSLRAWQNEVRRSIVWEKDGVESSVAIQNKDALAFYVNGKSDGNSVKDAGTQIMLGLIGGALHPEPKRAFVVGLGTGETAGWLAEIPSIQQVDVVELEPAIQEMAHRCRAINHDVLSHPKVRMIFNDAREVLLTNSERYDLIVCEPSNPYRSGVANLFTQEFYRVGSEQLNAGGMFVQWIQAYETDERTMRTVFATFKSVFSHVEVWESMGDDLVLVGCNHEPTCSAIKLRSRLATEPFASALLHAWHTTDLEGFFSRYVGGRSLVEGFIEKGPSEINTDDRNGIEYAFARTVGISNSSVTEYLHRYSAAIGDQEHPVQDEAVDWETVALDRLWFIANGRSKLFSERGTSTVAPSQIAVLERFIAKDMSGMLSKWESSPHDKTCLSELAVIALNYAKLGSNKAEPLAEQLHRHMPIEADMVRGILASKQNRLKESSEILATAFQQLRLDPWPLASIRESALDAAIAVSGAGTKNNSSNLLSALSEPFQVFVANESRRDCACFIASSHPEVAARFVETYEPHVPWSKRFLSFRKQVYLQSGHPLAGQADRDLREFLRNAAVPEPTR